MSPLNREAPTSPSPAGRGVVTKSHRAAELARLAWLADSGRLCVGSDNPDVARMLAAIGPVEGETFGERVSHACMLFASAAMTEAVRLGYVE